MARISMVLEGGATVQVKEDRDLVFVDLLEAAEVWEVGRVC